MVQCPRCGCIHDATIRVEINDPDLLLVYQVVEALRRDAGKATTKAVAVRIGYSDMHTRRFLTALEQRNLVTRIGKKKGWLPSAC